MQKFLNQNKSRLDEDSLRRLNRNPLRILDSKNQEMAGLIAEAPKMVDHLDEESKLHFSILKNYLDSLGINYKVNPRLIFI